MGMHLSRRDLLRLSAAACMVPAAGAAFAAEGRGGATAKVEPKPEPAYEELSAYQEGPQIWIRWNNTLLTSYRAHATQKYPWLYPLAGPSTGLSLTTESSHPWPHHRSLMFGCDRVNGGNYWQDPVDRGQIVSVGLKLGKTTEDSAEFTDRCEWRRPRQPVVMTDQRKVMVKVVHPKRRVIDVEITWTAVEDVVIQKTNHSLFAVRATPDIAPVGGGTLLNSQGDSGEKATFGKPAGWCTFFGKRRGIHGDVVEGIAVFDSPKNPWKDCTWFTRDYGFMSPSPFNFMDKPWQLAAGKSIELRYRVVLYAGDPSEAGLAELHKEWIAG